MYNKPVVTFDLKKTHHIRLGYPAHIFPKDHPSPLVSNSQIAHTSSVKSMSVIDGIIYFETENTKYIGE